MMNPKKKASNLQNNNSHRKKYKGKIIMNNKIKMILNKFKIKKD